ncbi:hypothetical protein FKM82_023993 [Ascaphus truei]
MCVFNLCPWCSRCSFIVIILFYKFASLCLISSSGLGNCVFKASISPGVQGMYICGWRPSTKFPVTSLIGITLMFSGGRLTFSGVKTGGCWLCVRYATGSSRI